MLKIRFAQILTESSSSFR